MSTSKLACAKACVYPLRQGVHAMCLYSNRVPTGGAVSFPMIVARWSRG